MSRAETLRQLHTTKYGYMFRYTTITRLLSYNGLLISNRRCAQLRERRGKEIPPPPPPTQIPLGKQRVSGGDCHALWGVGGEAAS